MDTEESDILLHLNGVCIQTAAKKAYEALLEEFLSSDICDHDALKKQRQFDILKSFLEEMDFPALRARDPDLTGAQATSVLLRKTAKGFEFKKIE